MDAASFHASNNSGFGMVVRRDDKSFIAAHTTSIHGVFNPIVIELMGVREALSWVKNQGW